jgi:hypothetical protein
LHEANTDHITRTTFLGHVAEYSKAVPFGHCRFDLSKMSGHF